VPLPLLPSTLLCEGPAIADPHLPNVWNMKGYDVMLSLRCLPGGNIITDQSCNTSSRSTSSSSSSSFTTLSAYESFRYFNCDMYFNEKSLNILLRSLPETTKRERKFFFKNILMCRRRLNKKWMTSPISKIFVISDQFGMLQQRALAVSLRHRIKQKALRISDGCFDGRLFSALSLSALSVPGVDPGVDPGVETGVDTTVY
jgi:hypothetical protein